QILGAVHTVLESTPDDAWDFATLHGLIDEEKKQRPLLKSLFLPVVRHALTAMKDGPPIVEVMVTLGKKRTLVRIKSLSLKI
ncbi:hypothetical protein FB451DRAFT_1244257, partial [Mycena latifolia]